MYRRWIEDWDGEFTGRHGRRLRIASATGFARTGLREMLSVRPRVDVVGTRACKR